jgi:prolipoprotein diacylglyceryl transferase
MIPILNVGPLAIQLPGLLLLGGIWAATLVIERSAHWKQLDHDALTNLIFTGLVIGILGARLGYALNYLDLYLADPGALVSLNLNTLSLPAGLITGILAALILVQRKGLPLLTVLDVIAPGLAVFMVAVALAHIASGDAYGAPTRVPWGIELWSARRHPSQFYEALAAGIITWIILRLGRRSAPGGVIFFILIALHAAARLFLEAFRGDSQLIFNTLRTAQVVSQGLLLLALVAIGRRANSSGDQTPA